MGESLERSQFTTTARMIVELPDAGAGIANVLVTAFVAVPVDKSLCSNPNGPGIRPPSGPGIRPPDVPGAKPSAPGTPPPLYCSVIPISYFIPPIRFEVMVAGT